MSFTSYQVRGLSIQVKFKIDFQNGDCLKLAQGVGGIDGRRRRAMDIDRSQKLTMSTTCSSELKCGEVVYVDLQMKSAFHVGINLYRLQ